MKCTGPDVPSGISVTGHWACPHSERWGNLLTLLQTLAWGKTIYHYFLPLFGISKGEKYQRNLWYQATGVRNGTFSWSFEMYSFRSCVGAWQDRAQCLGTVLPIHKTVNVCRYKQAAVKVMYEYKETFAVKHAGCLAGNTDTYSTTGVRNCVWFYDKQLLELRIRIQKGHEQFCNSFFIFLSPFYQPIL